MATYNMGRILREKSDLAEFPCEMVGTYVVNPGRYGAGFVRKKAQQTVLTMLGYSVGQPRDAGD